MRASAQGSSRTIALSSVRAHPPAVCLPSIFNTTWSLSQHDTHRSHFFKRLPARSASLCCDDRVRHRDGSDHLHQRGNKLTVPLGDLHRSRISLPHPRSRRVSSIPVYTRGRAHQSTDTSISMLSQCARPLQRARWVSWAGSHPRPFYNPRSPVKELIPHLSDRSGRTDWEGFASATIAAASGGVTTIIVSQRPRLSRGPNNVRLSAHQFTPLAPYPNFRTCPSTRYLRSRPSPVWKRSALLQSVSCLSMSASGAGSSLATQ
jgi:hypothetical protein